jgi:glycosyltransferase involved in cell wall biosynthesis
MAGAMTPEFSVIVPVYNRANVLGRTLQSVLDQTFQDFEIVVVDDGSSDDPAAVVEKFADPRIRFLRQENRGGGAARNAGIDAARGRLVAFLDSDDEFLPHHLENMHRLLATEEDTVGYARIVVDRGEGRTLLKPPRAIRAGEHMAIYLLNDRGFVPTITLALPREIAQRVRYSEALPFAQDTDFALRLYLDGCHFRMIEEPGAVWHDLPDLRRVSASRKGALAIGWIESMRHRIPSRAYHACRGWMIAKGVAPRSKVKALALYLTALLHGCYRPRLAAIVFLQIFLSDQRYRNIADRAVGLMGWRRRHAADASAAAELQERPC